MTAKSLVSQAVYKAKWFLARPQAFTAWDAVRRNEREPLEKLLAAQETARQRIVALAMSHTAFYREHYTKAGFELGDMRQDGWFENLPIITKKDLRERFEGFVDQEQRRFLRISTTGGSTGVPTKTGYDGRIPEEVYSWRLQDWFGVNPWDDHAYVWRDTRPGRMAKLKNFALWWPTRHLKMDATFITEEGMACFVKKFNRLRPAMLQGYVGAVTQLAQFVLENKMAVHSPRFVWTTSAPLPDSQRALVSEAFHAPVCDQYGSCEIRWIAAQCTECGGLHVNTEHVHVEFVDDSNHPVEVGHYGKTLLTNLEDTVFPLIRYENGDRGRWLGNSCPCGRTLPMVDSVKGRESESFVLPSGKTVNGEFLTTIFDSAPDLVKGFRCVQHRDLSITIEYIPAGEEAEILRILDSFAGKLGNDTRIEFKCVESIPHDRGKLRFVVRE